MSSISISYCGGCNEGYSRTALVRAILQRLDTLSGAKVEIVGADQEADVQLVVCGCMTMCVAYRKTQSPAKACLLIAPDHLDYAPCPQAEIIERIAERFSQIKEKSG